MMPESFDLDSEKGREDYREALMEQINNANALDFMTKCEGWEILINSLREKKQTQIDILMEQPPGDDQTILRLHAVGFAVAHTIDDVSDSVLNAIENGYSARLQLAELDNQPQYEDET